MAMFLNTEAAPALFQTEDLFIVATLNAIHEVMVFGAGRPLRPNAPFDLLFFYCTVVESLAQRLRYALAVRLPDCQNATAINVPDLQSGAFRETFFVTSGLATAFRDAVRRRTSADGVPFDESYAMAIAALAFDAPTVAAIEGSKGKRYVRSDDWEDFLRGFNAP